MTSLDDIVHKALQAERPLPVELMASVARDGLDTQRTPPVDRLVANHPYRPGRQGDQRRSRAELAEMARTIAPGDTPALARDDDRITVLTELAGRDDLPQQAYRLLAERDEPYLAALLAALPRTTLDEQTRQMIAATLVAACHPAPLAEVRGVLGSTHLTAELLAHPDANHHVLAATRPEHLPEHAAAWLAVLSRELDDARSAPGDSWLTGHGSRPRHIAARLADLAWQGVEGAAPLARDLAAHGQLSHDLRRELTLAATVAETGNAPYRAGEDADEELFAQLADCVSTSLYSTRPRLTLLSNGSGYHPPTAEQVAFLQGLLANPRLGDDLVAAAVGTLHAEEVVAALGRIGDPDHATALAARLPLTSHLAELALTSDLPAGVRHTVGTSWFDPRHGHGAFRTPNNAEESVRMALDTRSLQLCPLGPVLAVAGSTRAGTRQLAYRVVDELYRLCGDLATFHTLRAFADSDLTIGQLVDTARAVRDPAA